jgi:NAD(P)-dependent dehydrogenase (short-subunit alcohol dehydrogenase family)
MLSNKVILVTGGSGLIGREIIRCVKSDGGIAINLDTHVSSNLMEGQWKCDITDAASRSEAVSAVMNQYGRIDGLVNNAYPRTNDFAETVEQYSVHAWNGNMDMQLGSYFFMSQEVLKYMAVQKSGSIVNMASIYGVVGNDPMIYLGTEMKTSPAYSAIKGGLINLTRYLAAYFGPQQIRINSVSPGGIFDHQPMEFVRSYEERVPLKRMGRPEDIAPAVSFLLSDDASYITGQNLCVDGGWTSI